MKNLQQIHKFPLLPSFLLRIFQKKKKKNANAKWKISLKYLKKIYSKIFFRVSKE